MSEDTKERIVEREIKEEMKKSYIEYSMSVIVGRALPDVRDGLKPVHRRILYSMNENSLTPDKPYRKSATIVGDVLGHYHPHGDTSVYDALVKLAQDFAIRYPLVDGHGNFGSIDGDSAAAMRYTESRMQKLAQEMLRDIDKETVDFMPNYDEELMEPVVLPSRYPNLLINGANGIAVGMATSIPPHNLGEVIDATVYLLDHEDADIKDIMKYIKGPDFPTGAYIMGKSGIIDAYRTGRGRIVQRAKTKIEKIKNGKSRIIVTEIPYQVNKARLVTRIDELIKTKKIDGMVSVKDMSNRKGIQIVIDLRRDANPEIILNRLYKYSPLQQTFSVIMLALVNNEPKILTLKEILEHYINHQIDVITRRTEFNLKKALDRNHILEGLIKAIDNIDEVINIIRSSYTDATDKLVERFNLSQIQAKAILDMQMRRLQGMEREKLIAESKDLTEKIAYYTEVLKNPQKLKNIIKTEITEIKEKYSDKRRTEFLEETKELEITDLIADEDVTITMTALGYIKRGSLDDYKTQKRGGKGISSISTRDEDYVKEIITATTHSLLLFFTDKGKIYKLNAYQIAETSRTSKGTNIVNLLTLDGGEKISTMLKVEETEEDKYVVLCTKNGTVKKTPIKEFKNGTRKGLIAIKLKEDDKLISTALTDGKRDIICTSKTGKTIIFNEKDIRSMGRTAQGVRAMKLSKNDAIVSMTIYEKDKDLLVISERGYGKRTALSEYTIQNRGGKGLKTYKINDKTGSLIGADVVDNEDEIIIINSDGTLIRMKVSDISVLSRATSGVRLMRTSDDTDIVSFAKITAEDIE